VVFNAITKSAVARMRIQHPREIDDALVDAYLARRALDYLVGFTCRRSCGESCPVRARQAASSLWRCGSSVSANWRSRPLSGRNTGPSKR
jgi:DNA topoisomerase IA